MKKPFFYRIDISALFDFATDPEGMNMSLLQFAKELQKEKSDISYIQGLINETKDFITKKAAAGKKGMENRWLKNSSDITNDNTVITVLSSDITNDNTPVTRSSNRSSTETIAVQKAEPKTLKPLSEYSDDFQKFWSYYPTKTGKGDAWKSWQKIRPPIEPVLNALRWQVNSKKWLEGYIPNPATYLNQRRWEDEPPQNTMTASSSAMGALARAAALRREQEERNAIQP